MEKIRLIRILHIVFVILIIISGFAFGRTNGLVLKGEDSEDIYVTDLLTSGSDDNITIEISSRLFIPVLLISLFRIFRNMKPVEYLFNNLISMLQIFFLLAIEAGSLFKTIIYDHNIPLLIWIIAFVLFVCLNQFFYLTNNTKEKEVKHE